jgi:hypothetical protein
MLLVPSARTETKEITYPQVLPDGGHASPYGGVPPHAALLLAVGPLEGAMGLHRAAEVSLPLPAH